MSKLAPVAKAVWAFAITVVGAVTTAVMSTDHQSFRDVGTGGWLSAISTVLITTGAVYGVSNKSDS